MSLSRWLRNVKKNRCTDFGKEELIRLDWLPLEQCHVEKRPFARNRGYGKKIQFMEKVNPRMQLFMDVFPRRDRQKAVHSYSILRPLPRFIRFPTLLPLNGRKKFARWLSESPAVIKPGEQNRTEAKPLLTRDLRERPCQLLFELKGKCSL